MIMMTAANHGTRTRASGMMYEETTMQMIDCNLPPQGGALASSSRGVVRQVPRSYLDIKDW
jgi:hypothetical protein